MAVAFDAVSNATRTTTADPFTFTHTPSGTPRGIMLAGSFGNATSPANYWGTVTYGGVAMTRVSAADAEADKLSVGERGGCAVWYLGTGIPTGAQTVSIDYLSAIGANDAIFGCVSVTAANDTELIDSDFFDTTVGTNPQRTLNYAGRTSLALAAIWCGFNGVVSFTGSLAGNTTVGSPFDFGSCCLALTRQTSAGSSDHTIGMSTSASDSMAMSALAISEVVTAPTEPPRHPGSHLGGHAVLAKADEFWRKRGRVFVPRLWTPSPWPSALPANM